MAEQLKKEEESPFACMHHQPYNIQGTVASECPTIQVSTTAENHRVPAPISEALSQHTEHYSAWPAQQGPCLSLWSIELALESPTVIMS